jgi:hypothetical protein
MKRCLCTAALLALALMTACGGGGSTSGGGGGGGGVTVSITPNSTVNVGVTLTQQFTATVSGSSNTAVNWTLSGSGCSGATCGSINSSGLYTAPPAVPNPATVTVTATSSADSTKSASVNVKVIDISVTVSPTTATVALNGTQQFNAIASPSNAPQTVLLAAPSIPAASTPHLRLCLQEARSPLS